MKHFIAVYYGEGHGNLAKTRAAILRAEKHNAVVIDAAAFKDLETVDRLDFVGVSDSVKQQIIEAYQGVAITLDEAKKEPVRIHVPTAWRKLSWTKLQALASEIEPNATIRNKDEASKIIEAYVGEED